MRCKTLTAIYKNEINTLKKLYEIDFLIHKSVRIHIEQFTVRKIEIDFTSEQLVDDLIAVLTKVERLLMLFDGYFMNLISIEFQDSAGCVPPNLKECAEHFMRRRLAYFHSNKILFSSNYLLDFSKVLTPALYEKWKGILEDLDVAHQVYLYSLCDTNQIGGTPYNWILDSNLPGVQFGDFNSVLLVIIGVIANGSVALIALILVMVLAWNYLKLLLEAAERYVVLGVLVFTAPLAFAMGAARGTNNIFKSWCRMFGGQLLLLIMNAWCLKLFVNMVGEFLANPLSL